MKMLYTIGCWCLTFSPWQCDLCQELEEISTGPSAAGDGNMRCKRKHSATLNAAELKVNARKESKQEKTTYTADTPLNSTCLDRLMALDEHRNFG